MAWIYLTPVGKDRQHLVNMDNVFMVSDMGGYRRLISIAPVQDGSRHADVTEKLEEIRAKILEARKGA